MKKEKISVIISVFNTERYLEKCLDSLLNQTYSNLELIIIEDGSNDHSKDILKKYEKEKKCKIIYNEGNRGLAYSRNIGVSVASGNYIGFIDSDDYVEKDYYKKLMDAMVQKKAEVAICDINLIFEDETKEIRRSCCEGKWNIVNIINNGMAASACNKLFKADLIKKYAFAVGKINEDIAVVVPALVKAKKIAYVKECYYNYVQRNNSIQNSDFSEKRFDIFEAVDTTLERIEGTKNFEPIKEGLIFNQIMLLLFYVIPKDKRFFYRYKILKKFYHLSKKYDIRQNKCYWTFSDESGRKHALYYRLLLKFECSGLCMMANVLFVVYDLLAKTLKKNVKNKQIDLNAVISVAKKQFDKKEENISVSVIVPNYNYEKYLYQRIYSILNQNYKIKELILLDDCSSDHSVETIDLIVKNIENYVTVKKVYNKKNSGSAFKQWKKGFDYATGDYVWIAEADDFCDSTLLSNIIKPLKKDSSIKISYSDTAFIDNEGLIFIKSIKPEIDIRKTNHWDKSYINDGMNEIKNYSFLNCTIANVSSCIIKNDDYSDFFKKSGEFKQAGDWLFYVNVMKSGKIAYTNKVLNYYRVHGNNVSSTMDKKKHIEEIKEIYKYYCKEFKLDEFHKHEMKKRIDFLKKCWKVK